ncbi:MAG: glycosyl hydrolase [Gemmatimonadota bacterium]|nr:glycosyl hydrolase [Gemmatimonadota bacterium]
MQVQHRPLRGFLTPLLTGGWLLAGTAGPMAAQQDLTRVLARLEWREIGPTIMGGRIADLAVVESNPAVFYVGVATGGVWKTTNHGTTFESLFDDQPTGSIGDVTLAPSNPNIVWVGSGEPQNRQSSPWGNGVYKSTDAGRTWQHMGLEDTHHVARIQIHPGNPDIVYVAAVGRLWGANAERGVFRTTDGGKTWAKVLYVDEHTGAIDLVMDPGDPNTLFAAMYQRQRTGWGFNGGGPGSGIHRTTDGGATWIELTVGLPEGDKGRIGLDIYRGDGNLVYAVVEADARAPGRGGFGQQGGDEARQNGVYRSWDRGDTWEQVSETNNRPMYYSQIRVDPNDPNRIYLGGANLYRSSDGGKTFTADAARGVHSDHHALWIDPHNSSHLILGGGGGVSVSWDRSDSWRQLENLPLAQFYNIGVDMREPYFVCGGLQDNGSWCGPSNTWSSQGIRTRDWYNVGGGDGFHTLMDPNDPSIVFAESQTGNLLRFSLTTMERQAIRPSPNPTEEEPSPSYRFNWNAPLVVSTHDPATLYYGGHVVLKSTDRGFTWTEVSPDLTKGIDRGELSIMGVKGTEPMMSPNDGISTYGNITTIAESPMNAGLLYVGTDDGNVQMTRDGGATWTDLTARFRGVPERTYVTRVVASGFNEGTVYVTFDGHRNDDFAAYAFVSDDFGRSFRAITTGLPDGWSVNVIYEHPRSRDLLFLGNEVGAYVSIDRGQHWTRLKNNLPTVPVDDIKVHPRDNDLILGTHGRGVWIMDDITPLQELTATVLAADAHPFSVRSAVSYNPYRPQGWTPGTWEAPNPDVGAYIRYYLKTDLAAPATVAAGGSNGSPTMNGAGTVKLTILDAGGNVVRELEGSGEAGIHHVVWDLRHAPPYEVPEEDDEEGGGGFGGTPRGPKVLPGTYTVRMEAAGRTASTTVDVRLDPRVRISDADLRSRQDALMAVYRLQKPVYEAGVAVRSLNGQLAEIRQLLRDQPDVPEAIRTEVQGIGRELREIGPAISQAAGGRGVGSIESSTTRPTADQLRLVELAWERVPPLIERLNAIITERMPALYRQLDEHGVRPKVGEAVAVPTR